MAVLRLIAWVLVGVALMLLGADIISTIEQGEPVVRTTAEVFAMTGLEIARGDGGGLAKAGNLLLDLPLWGIVGAIGIVLTLIFRPID